MQIRAAVLRAHEQPLVIEGVELDDPRPNEAVVRLISSSLCPTDLVTRDCYHTLPLPCVPGHEGAGAVEAVGAVYTCATWITLSWVLRRVAWARIVCTGLLTVRTPGRCCTVWPEQTAARPCTRGRYDYPREFLRPVIVCHVRFG